MPAKRYMSQYYRQMGFSCQCLDNLTFNSSAFSSYPYSYRTANILKIYKNKNLLIEKCL